MWLVDSVEGIKFLVGNPEGEILLARTRHGIKSNVILYFKQVLWECEGDSFF
jgi:hypothetical protein